MLSVVLLQALIVHALVFNCQIQLVLLLPQLLSQCVGMMHQQRVSSMWLHVWCCQCSLGMLLCHVLLHSSPHLSKLLLRAEDCLLFDEGFGCCHFCLVLQLPQHGCCI